MSNILQILKDKFPDIKRSLRDVSDGLCPLNDEALKLDILKRQDINGKVKADTISTPDTIGIFNGRIIFVEFKSLKEEQLANRDKRLSLFLKQVDILVFLSFLEKGFVDIILDRVLEFWLVYGKESFRKAIKRHFKAYGIDKRYGFVYRAIHAISKDNFVKFLNEGKLQL